MSKKEYRGECLCGAVKLRVKEFSKEGICFCHCDQCRKNYGLYGAFIGMSENSFSVSGEKSIRWYKSSQKVRRGFCKTCGSAIFWKHEGHKFTYALAGLFAGLKVRKGLHIFLKDKGGFYTLHDTLPKYRRIPT